ncbi:hypothetical protein DCCM_2031 [Desulfocucumis palustris]|uniref:Uncharacterized protein n=1 Tax=Desulfocucumis palustris TaxID=1898651 RepID=A0A2L2XAE4_9FIRM|nr:hypothetical protein [Desulfocucumis palustris]GBF32934.1 hypothetical protein DCCM_2031 [Desulfocucumis palustris]
MPYNILTRVEKELSVDPSYVVRYQVFDNDTFLGDGVVQYHRLASHNDISIPDSIKTRGGNPLPPDLKEQIKEKIKKTVIEALP